MNTLKKIAFGAAVLTGLAACAGNPQPKEPAESGLIAKCANKLSLCARPGYENFAAIGEGSTKQDAYDSARWDIRKQIANYLFGSRIIDSQTSVTSSVGKSSGLPKTDRYEKKSTQVRVMGGTLPEILWKYECSANSEGNKCYVVGYIPK